MPVQIVDRSILFTPGWGLSPAERAEALADYAQGAIVEAETEIASTFGAPPKTTISVDGTVGKAITSVKPDGTIVATFDLVTDVIGWIFEQVLKHSPVETGQYRAAHRIFADHVEVETPSEAVGAKEIVISSTVPYARKIEGGRKPPQSGKAVYQVVAQMAKDRFGNVARIKFDYREIVAPGSRLAAWANGHGSSIQHDRKRAQQRKKDLRQPCIVISVA